MFFVLFMIIAMGETQELQTKVNGHWKSEEEPKYSPENAEGHHQASSGKPKQYKWWLKMAIYGLFVLGGQSVGTLLGRVYFENGGNSKWMATLVQLVGFPVLLPFLFISKDKDHNAQVNTKQPSALILASIYIVLGIFLAFICLMYSIGLQNLPVTTYSLICASQLGFNALFSFFLNAQKITPYIVNSLVLLTISSTVLVFETDTGGESNKTSKGKYVLGFVCTFAASAGYALMLSVTQLVFRKIIRRETLRAIIDMSVYESLAASFAILIGLFASGDWRKLSSEMEGFKLGKVSYVMNLFWTAVSWQIFNVGCVGLIFKISSLFSNVISVLGVPIAPILAVIFLHDRLNGLKAMAMVLAMWGFVSYMYQHYLDDLKTKAKAKSQGEN